jgi:hypothetical protein
MEGAGGMAGGGREGERSEGGRQPGAGARGRRRPPALVFSLDSRVRCSASPFFSIFTSCRGLLRSVRAVSGDIYSRMRI